MFHTPGALFEKSLSVPEYRPLHRANIDSCGMIPSLLETKYRQRNHDLTHK